MVASHRHPAVPPEVGDDASVMDGVPVVWGTRIPAETIPTYLTGEHSYRDIFENYPISPMDGIEAVVHSAEAKHGPNWRRHHAA